MEHRRIYVSGQITGLPPEQYKALFSAAEADLKARGWEVVNPIRIAEGIAPSLIDPATRTEAQIWREHLKADIA